MGEKQSLYKLAKYLENSDRELRQKAWLKQHEMVASRKDKYNKIFDKLLKLHTKTAKKSGYVNVRDYYHDFKGRFDYRPEDCIIFHSSIEKKVLPVVKKIYEYRKKVLGVDVLRPWDKAVPLTGKILKPYETEEELLDKIIEMFTRVKPEFGKTLAYMKHHGFIDSENRKGKTPGAMCMPLMDHQCGFILANCVGTNADVGTLAHEGGHAIHDASMSELPIELYRDAITFPMELAEVGSMTMEFLVLDHLDVIYTNEEDIRQAKIQALIEPIIFLPWCAIVDAFQQWIYTNLNHTHEERMEKFSELMDQFEIASGVDYSGLEEQKPLRWLRQNHIFQMPFYYIEYGISQLAAVGIYRNYKKDKQKAVEQFHQMLKLGNSKSMPEIYKAGGIPFDFSETYIGELMDFLVSELASLDAYGFGSK